MEKVADFVEMFVVWALSYASEIGSLVLFSISFAACVIASDEYKKDDSDVGTVVICTMMFFISSFLWTTLVLLSDAEYHMLTCVIVALLNCIVVAFLINIKYIWNKIKPE